MIFSSCVPRVRRTSAANTSLKVRPLDEPGVLEYPEDPDVETDVAVVAVSYVLDASELVTPLCPNPKNIRLHIKAIFERGG